jgi:membrane-bound lytic murein transglycosylase
VSLTPGASLAVDPRIHALGAPFYLDAGGPDPVQGILVAQDIGGAIRGSVRGDIFFGFGAGCRAARRGDESAGAAVCAAAPCGRGPGSVKARPSRHEAAHDG